MQLVGQINSVQQKAKVLLGKMQIQDHIPSQRRKNRACPFGKDEKAALLIHHQDGDHHRILEADGGCLLFNIKKIVCNIIRVVEINLFDTFLKALICEYQ